MKRSFVSLEAPILAAETWEIGEDGGRVSAQGDVPVRTRCRLPRDQSVRVMFPLPPIELASGWPVHRVTSPENWRGGEIAPPGSSFTAGSEEG